VNHPLVVGGQLINPGDILKGDADGVVVVRPEEAEEVIRLCQEREDHEDEIRAAHRRQEKTLIELHGLTEKLKAKGLLVEE
jgi:4-hydroxy-4-methyl-2-oxoglutarate aldolase